MFPATSRLRKTGPSFTTRKDKKMADPKATNPGGAGAAQPKPATAENTPPKESLAARGASHAAKQAFLKIRKPAAKWAAKHMPEALKDQAKAWASWMPALSILIATVTPDSGLWEEIDAFQQDFFDALEQELKHPGAENGTAAAVTPKPAAGPDPLDLYARIGLVANTLDPKTRDAFYFWYGKLTPERREKFHRLLEKATDAQLADYMKLSAAELTARVNAMPDPPKPVPPPPTFAQIRAAVQADATLNSLLTALLGRLNPERHARFWKAAESKIKSVDEFQALLAFTDGEIVETLDLDRKTLTQTANAAADSAAQSLSDAITATGLDAKLASAKANADARLQRARNRWNR